MDKNIEKDPFFFPQSTKLHSTVSEVGDSVMEVITMAGGYKKTFRGVLTDTFMTGEFTHFNTKDGRKVMVRTDSVLFIEVTKEK
jgi:hypothetical protein